MKSRFHVKPTVFVFFGLILLTASVGLGHSASLAASKQGVLEVVAQGNTAFALDLYAHLKDQEGNLFFSPFSLSTALAMCYAGAQGNTATQMADVLHFVLGSRQLHQAFAQLIGQFLPPPEPGVLQKMLHALNIKALFRDSQPEPTPPGYQLWLANALWGQRDYKFLKEFLDLTKSSYRVGLHKVDFMKDPDAVRNTINDWVARQTQNKIQDLIKPGILDTRTRLVLTNAIYFYGTWKFPFDQADTRDAPFTLLNSQQVIVPMMNQELKLRYPYMENDRLQLLELPYLGNEVSMLVILPKELTGLPDLEHSLTVENLMSWVSELQTYEVLVSLPKFNMTSEFSLVEVLENMGMTDAFSQELADFSGITKMARERKLYISHVLHKAFVDVNEKGTEAAAASAALYVEVSELSSGPKHFRADHPFLFLIRDNRTESIVFLGRVTNP